MIEMSPELVTILMFIGILGGLALGHPCLYPGWTGNDLCSCRLGTGRLVYVFGPGFDSTTNNILIAIPNFVLMATLLGKSGIADRLFRSIMYLLGPLNEPLH
jgi:TRAP-type mannitol/chloroaromatic compound transport system permease large subunit